MCVEVCLLFVSHVHLCWVVFIRVYGMYDICGSFLWHVIALGKYPRYIVYGNCGVSGNSMLWEMYVYVRGEKLCIYVHVHMLGEGSVKGVVSQEVRIYKSSSRYPQPLSTGSTELVPIWKPGEIRAQLFAFSASVTHKLLWNRHGDCFHFTAKEDWG